MKNIFAVTEQTTAPAFVSLNDNRGTTVLTVRSRGESGVTMPTASMVLTDEELAKLASSIMVHLAAKAKA